MPAADASSLFKECELRRDGTSADPTTVAKGRVAAARIVRWLRADQAHVGRTIELAPGERWEIVSAPEPALPASILRRLGVEVSPT